MTSTNAHDLKALLTPAFLPFPGRAANAHIPYPRTPHRTARRPTATLHLPFARNAADQSDTAASERKFRNRSAALVTGDHYRLHVNTIPSVTAVTRVQLRARIQALHVHERQSIGKTVSSAVDAVPQVVAVAASESPSR